MNLITRKGYDFGEVSSAFQKCIRRGLENDALYWAAELDKSGFGEYVWKRIRIITSEDIGIAAPYLPSTIRALYENWSDLRKQKDAQRNPERLFLIHAVILLVRSKKSRMVDSAYLTFYNMDEKRPMPDFALDKFTKRGRMKSRGWDHFFAEATLLGNPSDIPDPYLTLAMEAAKGVSPKTLFTDDEDERPE